MIKVVIFRSYEEENAQNDQGFWFTQSNMCGIPVFKELGYDKILFSFK